ncbi:MAG TPA: hypothetical protein VNU84_04300, partial [Candidatus Acidoferrum sp.]|nr:hypothetical protein [Candidatus Acidoferrum sp.]
MTSSKLLKTALVAMALAFGCSATPANQAAAPAKPKVESWGKTPAGEPVDLYTLTNAKGMEARIITYGGIVVSIKVPDRTGKFGDVVNGFDSLAGYVGQPPPPFFGALVGRYGNRIGGASFTLDGVKYTLAANDGANSLHGGTQGFDKVVWKAKPLSAQSLELTHLSKDGDQGFPGNLSVTVIYTVTDNNEFKIDYSATTDKDT